MPELITELDPEAVRRNLERIRDGIAATGRDPDGVDVLVATKYLPPELLLPLADAGVRLVGENRAQDLLAKQALAGERFTWDFIGALQSRKVKQLLGRVRLIHSLASESALAQLERHAGDAGGTAVLIEVELAGDPGKAGVAPEALPAMIERCPLPVRGLMTMPPQTGDAEANRGYFRQLRALADAHGLSECSMGTSQDHLVAVEEGATIIRLGSVLLRGEASSAGPSSSRTPL